MRNGGPANEASAWTDTRTNDVGTLRDELERTARMAKKGVKPLLAWRGHARAEWKLETTLDRRLEEVAPNESYEQWLGREQAVIERFRTEARVYTSETEARNLQDMWSTLAFGRHAGLPTRLLDWTLSPWVAAWFACREHSDGDGAIWWFNQTQLQEVLHRNWDNWDVPTRAQHQGITDLSGCDEERLGLNQRALEATAFNPNGSAWISKLHYFFPCPRMEAQQGFATVCGRLRTAHDDAIDRLPQNIPIERGRIVIGNGIKGKILEMLRTMNIHAKSLEYPGVDIVARGISP